MEIPSSLPTQEPPALSSHASFHASLSSHPSFHSIRAPTKPPPPRSFNLKFTIGDACLAKWEDGGYYFAIVDSDLGQDFVIVSFPANGDKKTMHKSQLRSADSTSAAAAPPSNALASPSTLMVKRDKPGATGVKLVGKPAGRPKSPRYVKLQELLRTERSFRDQLLFIMNEFFAPLAQQKIISREDTDAVLLNLDEIVSLSSQICSEIEELVIVFQDTTTIGDVLLQLSPNFAVYFQYVAKQSHAKQVLQNLKKNKAWLRFSSEFSRSARSTLETYLVLPLQRLPQYVFLISQIKNETPEQHSDFVLLSRALTIMTEHLNEVNGSIGQQALTELITKFASPPPGLKILGRWLICEGRALVTAADENFAIVVTKYHLFLFNDCFAFAAYMPTKQQKHEYSDLRCKIPVDHFFRVEDVGEMSIWIGRADQLSFTITFDQTQDKTEWLSAFRNVISNNTRRQQQQEEDVEGEEINLSRTDVNSPLFLALDEGGAGGHTKKKITTSRIDHVNYENGAQYVGEIKDGKMNGRGMFHYGNGDIYEGNFKDDKPHGQGDFLYANGDRFKGEFSEGKKNGPGVKYLADGEMIECAWKNDLIEGRGTYYQYSQVIFEGKWQQGEVVERVDRAYNIETLKYLRKRLHLIDEMRKMVCEILDGKLKATAYSFVILFNRCKKHNVITDILQPETHELKHWLISALAQQKALKERILLREAAERALPKTVMHMANGDNYSGQMKDGMFSGIGVYTCVSGEKYEGLFAKGKREGHGVLFDSSGGKFTGDFHDDKKNGPGMLCLINGDKIEAIWVDDILQGRGTLTNKKDEVFDGVWERGNLVAKVLRAGDERKDGKLGALGRKLFSRNKPSTSKQRFFEGGGAAQSAKADTRLNLVANPSLDGALLVPSALHFFTKFLAQERSEENIEFWHAINNFSKNCHLAAEVDALKSPQEKETLTKNLAEQCVLITATYIGSGASRQVNISSELEHEARQAASIQDPVARTNAMIEKLAVCQTEIVKLLAADSFRRFIRSEFWKEFLATLGENEGDNKSTSHTVHLANGDLYEGEMTDNRFHGFGTYKYNCGDKYVGKWNEGQMHGYGEFSWKSGQRFLGEFHEHRKHGEGVMYQANGDRIEAAWSKGNLHGRGTHYSSTGQVYDAVWVNAELDFKVDRTPHKLLAVYTYPNVKRPGKTKTRLVHCTTSVFGVDIGWKSGKTNHQETINWRAMEKVEIDLRHPQIELYFNKYSASVSAEGSTSLVITPCNPFVVSSLLMTLMDLMERGEPNQTFQSQTTLVRCKMLLARISAGVRHRKDKMTRLEENAALLEQQEQWIVTNLVEKQKAIDEENFGLADKKKVIDKELHDRKAELLLEREQISLGLTQEWQFEADVSQLLDDFKDLTNCQSHLIKTTPQATAVVNSRTALSDALVRQAKASALKVKQEIDEMVSRMAKLLEKEGLTPSSEFDQENKIVAIGSIACASSTAASVRTTPVSPPRLLHSLQARPPPSSVHKLTRSPRQSAILAAAPLPDLTLEGAEPQVVHARRPEMPKRPPPPKKPAPPTPQ